MGSDIYMTGAPTHLSSTNPETVLVLSLTLMNSHILLSLERPDLPLQSEGYPFDFQVLNRLLISGMVLTYHCMSERSERYTLTDNETISLVGVRVCVCNSSDRSLG